MPANLNPEYKAAETAYKQASEPSERLQWLREMLRAIPKHKGTEHLQAAVKTRIRELSEEIAAPRKGGARGGPPTVFRQEGAAQLALLGPPNSGKSALHARLTGSHAETGPYPFTTQFPIPGMYPHLDIAFQLLDMPPISPHHPVPWIANALQPTDAALLVVDLGEPGCVEAVVQLHQILADRKVILYPDWASPPDVEDPFAKLLPAVLAANKADRIADLDEEIAALQELGGFSYTSLSVSAETGEGIDALGRWLFQRLEIVRVYTKVPGKPQDMGRPYTVRAGQTVEDVAIQVHRDFAGTLIYARLWASNGFDGQQVGREHEVTDGDVLELHS